jgi:hypothetical protein
LGAINCAPKILIHFLWFDFFSYKMHLHGSQPNHLPNNR